MRNKIISKLFLLIGGLLLAILTDKIEYYGLAAIFIIVVEIFYWYWKKRDLST